MGITRDDQIGPRCQRSGQHLVIGRIARDGEYTAYTAAGFPAFYLQTSVSQKTSAASTVLSTTAYNAANKYPHPTTVNLSSTIDYEQYGYDANANLTSLRKRSGQSITLAYDNLGRLLSRTYPSSADNVAYTYDLLGRRLTATGASAADNVSYVWDNAGRLLSTTANGRTLSYLVDATGNRTRTTWPEATPFYVTTDFDALNRPSAIKELGVTSLASYAYDDLSRRTTVTLGNGTTTTYGYDSQAALSSLAHNLTGTAQDQTYGYTRNQAREIATHSWSNDLYGYTRNQAREIATHSWSNDLYQWPVTGNVANGTKSYTANGLNQYTAAAGATVTHDSNGNITGDGSWTYGYDLDRCLRRHGAGNLNALKPQEPAVVHKAFKSYEPGYVHMDVKYLPQMQDENSRRYLFVAIDRATRWVFVQLKTNKTAASAQAFLKALHKACPIRIAKLLTDNGKEFTDRLFASREREPSGNHEFDQLCKELGIEHRLTKPRTPRTNGMVERFNGRIADVLKTHRFNSREDMEQTLVRYVALYNHQLPQSALKSNTPMQAMKEWYQAHPHLFQKRPYDRPGCDT